MRSLCPVIFENGCLSKMYAIQTGKTKMMKLCRPGATAAAAKKKKIYFSQRERKPSGLSKQHRVCACVEWHFHMMVSNAGGLSSSATVCPHLEKGPIKGVKGLAHNIPKLHWSHSRTLFAMIFVWPNLPRSLRQLRNADCPCGLFSFLFSLLSLKYSIDRPPALPPIPAFVSSV